MLDNWWKNLLISELSTKYPEIVEQASVYEYKNFLSDDVSSFTLFF